MMRLRLRLPRSSAWLSLAACGCVAAAVAATALPAPAHAQSRQGARHIVIYRCTDAAGRLTIQNDVACPKGSRETRERVDVPPPMPAYVAREERMPEVVAEERAQEAAEVAAAATPGGAPTVAPAIAPANAPAAANTGAQPASPPAPRGPPPALYACRTWNQVDYLTEDSTPHEQCAPLQVVGVDGVARSDANACEKVTDQCEAVPADQLCASWRRRVSEAEFRWKFAGAKQDDGRRREYETLAATLAASDCGSGQKP